MRFPKVLPVLVLICALVPDVFASEQAWLEVDVQPGATVAGPSPVFELSGRAMADRGEPFDLVVLLDRSASSLLPAGLDVDGDGHVGRMRTRALQRASYRRWTTDRDDTVFEAEKLAAMRLVSGLDPERVRIAVVAFAGRTRTKAGLGRPELALAALEKMRPRRDRSGTDIGRALRRGLRILDKAPDAETRAKVIVLLSDGSATAPRSAYSARRLALRAGQRAAERGVRIYGLTLGHVPLSGEALLGELADASGGGVVALDEPGSALPQLAPIAPMQLDQVVMRNRSTGSQGRAVRLFGDGSFDGMISLGPGANRLQIRARTVDGKLLETEQVVHYERRSGPADALEALRARTIETALARQARSGHRSTKNIQLAVE